MVRFTVCYTGQVQGVGFRYKTARIAERFAVSGYVTNLPDGRVKLVVEAEREEAYAFEMAVMESLGHYVIHAEQNIDPPTGAFGNANAKDSFTIRY